MYVKFFWNCSRAFFLKVSFINVTYVYFNNKSFRKSMISLYKWCCNFSSLHALLLYSFFFFTLEVVHLTVKSNKCCSRYVVSFYYRAYKITFWGSNTLLPLNVIAIKISQSWSNQQYWMLVSHLWCVARFSTIRTI